MERGLRNKLSVCDDAMDEDYLNYLKEKGCCHYKEVEVPILKDGVCKFEKKMAEVYDITPEIVKEYAKLKNISYEVLEVLEF